MQEELRCVVVLCPCIDPALLSRFFCAASALARRMRVLVIMGGESGVTLRRL